MERLKNIFSVLGIGGTICELIIIAFYFCLWLMIGDLTIAYIENAEKTGVTVGEFAFTITMFLAGSFILLFVARFVFEYLELRSDDED